MSTPTYPGKYLALTGGVGGAKLALGLSQLLGPTQLAFAVNVADDFTHLGLHISPDIDTLLYTLAGENNPDTGWGRRDESWHFMAALRELNGPDWFNLGDRDLATHVQRTQLLRQGASLTQVVAQLAQQLGVAHPIYPITDDPLQTRVQTAQGELAFQDYFVRMRAAPAVQGFHFQGVDSATLNPALAALLRDPALRGVILCPSNPYVSMDPILAVADLRQQLAALQVPVIAVSPIVAGQALKGPAAKMMQELGLPVCATAVAEHYADCLDGFVLDTQDAEQCAAVRALGLQAWAADSVMLSLDDKVRLARQVLACIQALGR